MLYLCPYAGFTGTIKGFRSFIDEGCAIKPGTACRGQKKWLMAIQICRGRFRIFLLSPACPASEGRFRSPVYPSRHPPQVSGGGCRSASLSVAHERPNLRQFQSSSASMSSILYCADSIIILITKGNMRIYHPASLKLRRIQGRHYVSGSRRLFDRPCHLIEQNCWRQPTTLPTDTFHNGV